jgi:hypothetical protein
VLGSALVLVGVIVVQRPKPAEREPHT